MNVCIWSGRFGITEIGGVRFVLILLKGVLNSNFEPFSFELRENYIF